jgi:hypothetical protein
MLSQSLEPIWPDSVLVFQWGDFSAREKERLRELHRNEKMKIVLDLPDESFAAASLALDWFTKHFAALQDRQFIDRSVRIIACYVDYGESAGCCARALRLMLHRCSQPTFLIHVNIHSVTTLLDEATAVVNAFGRRLAPRVDLSADAGRAANCALLALTFVFFHELAHIVRGHLDWGQDEGKRERKALELDADFISAVYCRGFMNEFFSAKGTTRSPFVEAVVAVIAMYSMFSTLREGANRGADARYYSRLSRLLHVAYRVVEGTDVDGETIAKLIQVLRNVAVETRRVPALHEQELKELIEITGRRLIELETQGRLKGYLRAGPSGVESSTCVLEVYFKLFVTHLSLEPAKSLFLDPGLLPAPKSEIRRQLLLRLQGQPLDIRKNAAPAVRFLAQFIDGYNEYESEVPGLFGALANSEEVSKLLAESLASLTEAGAEPIGQSRLSMLIHAGQVYESYANAQQLLERDLEKLGVS